MNCIIAKKTRRDGSIYYVRRHWVLDGYYQMVDTKYPSFVDAVLAERRNYMAKTVKSVNIFGDPNNA